MALTDGNSNEEREEQCSAGSVELAEEPAYEETWVFMTY